MHPNANNFCVTNNEAGYLVTNRESNSEYEVMPNDLGCVQENCRVRCAKCNNPNACARSFVCSCMRYSLRNVCKHSHVVTMWLGLQISDSANRMLDIEGAGTSTFAAFPTQITLSEGEMDTRTTSPSEENSDTITFSEGSSDTQANTSLKRVYKIL